MSSIILKPWPFEDRIVKLHWFGNVKLNSANNWRIRVAFEDQKKIVLINFPIGLLPILRIGQYYHKGMPFVSNKEGIIDTVKIKSLTKGRTDKAIDICRRFSYFLYGKAELINQKMWSFESDGILYHIPHVELIRAFYTKNKVIANAMLRPNGLEYLLNNYSVNENKVSIDFTSEIPSTLISNAFVQHFTWIYFNEEVRNTFESIQSNVYVNSSVNSLSFGQPLKMNIPNLENTNWTYRGQRIKNEVFIYELMGFSGAELQSDKIEYSHPSIKRRVYRNFPRKKQISKKASEQNFELENHEVSKSKVNTNQPIIEQEATQIMFNKNPIIKSFTNYIQEINQGDEYVNRQGPGGVLTKKVNVDESIFGGTVQPIDFKTLEIININNFDGYGLEDFLRIVKELKKMNPDLNISMSLVNLPLGRKFSWLPDGRRRTCLIVKVDRLGKFSKYILEVARPDNRSLSTLILSSKNNKMNEDEVMINFILESLVSKSGHWDKKFLLDKNYVLLKHINTHETLHWSVRVYRGLVNCNQFSI